MFTFCFPPLFPSRRGRYKNIPAQTDAAEASRRPAALPAAVLPPDILRAAPLGTAGHACRFIQAECPGGALPRIRQAVPALYGSPRP